MRKSVSCFTARKLSSKRQGFGSFHSEDIEVLVRSPVQLSDRLLSIRRQSEEELDTFLSEFPTFSQSKKSDNLRSLFSLTEEFTFLNHGAFGGALSILSNQAHRWRIECEKQPLRFFDRDLFPLMASSLQDMSNVLNCDPADLLPLQNVTTGLNALTHSIILEENDEIIIFSLTYGSTKKIVKDWAMRANARVRTIHIPLPLQSSSDILQRISLELSVKSKVIIIDHITSNTAIQLPVREIAQLCKQSNPAITVVVDAAHSLFSQHISIHQSSTSINSTKTNDIHSDFKYVDFWLTNAHKWMSAPKGAALMWVNPRTVEYLHPAIVSHGYSPPYETNQLATMLSRGKFLSGFSWDGCRDYAAFLTLPSAVAVWDKLERQLVTSHQNSFNDANDDIRIEERCKYRWDHFRQIYMHSNLDKVEEMFTTIWSLQPEDFPCSYEMRRYNPMRLVRVLSF